MAKIVFDKLEEKNCDFSKLVSITTDGASNMIGQEHGMANEIVKMANEKMNANRRFGVDVHCLWCIAHRLNLVAQDFKEVENINFVIKFAKWITASDRLVSYASFLRMRYPGLKPKKLPPPSETRWLYYRDTLRAVLDQKGMIDEFMSFQNNREKWRQHISTSKHPLGPIQEVPFSFREPLIKAHFKFALFVLDVLGEINTIFQAKYGLLPDLWEYLPSLGQFLRNELWKIQFRRFDRFPFLSKIGLDKIPQFVSILKHLIMNLTVRFSA